MLGDLWYTALAFIKRPSWLSARSLAMGESQTLAPQSGKGDASVSEAIMVFAATIGEINGIRPLTVKLSERFLEPHLIFITKKDIYESVVLKQFPKATVIDSDAMSLSTTERLLNNYAVKALLIAEGPALLARFSMYLSPALPLRCRARNVPVFVVNACLFPRHLGGIVGRNPLLSTLFDFMFFSSFTRSIAHWYAPYPEVAEALVRSGATSGRVSVVGDIKFDVSPLDRNQTQSADLLALLESLKAQEVPIIVAGSVTNFGDIDALISAWRAVRKDLGRCILVLAPRRIHDKPHMEALYRHLAESGVAYRKRSDVQGDHDGIEFLVLDTFGELSELYSISTVCFIARNHGVLEPLFFGKPVVVGPEQDWVAPSALPQYRFMVASGAIYQLSDNAQMAVAFGRLIEDSQLRNELIDRANAVLSAQRGALDRVYSDIASRMTDS